LGIELGANSAKGKISFNFRGYDDVDGDLDAIKKQIPTFQGKNDFEAYLK
jgi:uncharacterized lipoprotein YajG